MDDPQLMPLLQERPGLGPQCRHPAGLDLDKEIITNQVDDKAIDWMLDQIAGTRIPALE